MATGLRPRDRPLLRLGCVEEPVSLLFDNIVLYRLVCRTRFWTGLDVDFGHLSLPKLSLLSKRELHNAGAGGRGVLLGCQLPQYGSVAPSLNAVLACLVSPGCQMRHCHTCGAEIRDGGYRRVVQTGANRRVYHGKRGTSVSTATSEGLRTLCKSCADLHDAEEAESFARAQRQAAFQRRAGLVFVCAVLALVAIAYATGPRKSDDPVRQAI